MGKLQRHAGIGYEIVQSLDVLVLQMVEQLPNVTQFFAACLPVVAEQVIKVPKIVCPPRAARTVFRAPQTAEQLVEVPTIISYSSLLQQTLEQNVDIPTSVRGVSGSLQGFPPQNSTRPQRTALQTADIPVLGRGDLGCLLGVNNIPPIQQNSMKNGYDENNGYGKER